MFEAGAACVSSTTIIARVAYIIIIYSFVYRLFYEYMVYVYKEVIRVGNENFIGKQTPSSISGSHDIFILNLGESLCIFCIVLFIYL